MKREEPTGWNVIDRMPPLWAWLVALAVVLVLAFAAGASLLAQSPSGEASVVLGWDANPPAEAVQGYKVEVLESGAAAAQVLDAGNVTQFKVPGLKPNVSYRFRVLAYDSDSSSDWSAAISGTPPAPYGADGSCATVAGSAPEVSVIIQSYDLQAKRSEPKGLLVRFDAGSSEPIIRLDLDMENDGEPAIAVTFPSGLGFDGRYVRALAFKPTINGTWPLLLTATDAVGRKASARCLPGVIVGF